MNVIIKFFQDGGFWMYPILIVGILGGAFAVERFIKLKLLERANRRTWNDIHPLLVKGDFDKARQMVEASNSAVGQLLTMGLEVQGTVRRRDDIEIAMEEAMMEITPQLEARTVYISMFANVATLLGLLGTIIGLISAFEAVANANPAEKSALLSSSIAMAMNTTAFGLIAAIPLLVCFNMVNSKTAAIVGSLEMISVKTLKLISTLSRRGFQAPPASNEADQEEEKNEEEGDTSAEASS
ncbi:MotA/TolQ/ExbB proton channel family protein [Alcanivorax sp. DP30]|uniref:MotA/TolQ/ExbB proton channel family protein n=1 Tax=Alcanivorax sp. DP30 TaxID=2606217 RepID=UPI00136B82AF|nr:MotA/TolQ/ExbB proton channel family protein [Alcanivorax sp. DP30]MZR62751.1 MotA/TolQ/ExbB proton channel family protein [Alcanivorax sp. DP30]